MAVEGMESGPFPNSGMVMLTNYNNSLRFIVLKYNSKRTFNKTNDQKPNQKRNE